MSLAAALVVSGCIGPDMSEMGDFGAFRSDLSTPQPHPVQIFIASTRKGETGGASREVAPEAHFKLATMTIPPGHRPGSIEAPLWGGPNAANDITVESERPLDPDEFRQELATHLSGRVGANRDVLLFVHGFNTSYEEARARAAQIVYEFPFRRRRGSLHLAVAGRTLRLYAGPRKRDVVPRRAPGVDA